MNLNPTPTPLASMAMEAATPRSDAFFDTCACRNYSSCWEFARQLERELAAFQPLLAKVEGERDAANARWQSTAKLADTELTALRADLAAKEEIIKDLCTAEESRRGTVEQRRWLTELADKSRSALASRADKGGTNS